MKPDLLESWNDLNNRHYGLMTLSEEECYQLLQMEVNGKARESYVLRIYQRYNAMRGKREYEEIISKIKTIN